MATLLLNADYNILGLSPLSVINWQNAVKHDFTGAAETVAYYDDWIVSSPTMELFVPSVMALKDYAKFRRSVKLTNKNLWLRDNYTCQYCSKVFPGSELTRDHVKPRSHGGKTNWENISTACKTCNHTRGNREHIRPAKEPWKPTIHEINAKLTTVPVVAQHESWIPFLAAYWDEDKIILNTSR